jgi:hypothetical protein
LKLALAFAAWLALGAPCAAPFWRRGRRLLALAVLPFAGSLALMLPVAAAPWLGGSLVHWPAAALLASVLLAGLALALLRGASDPAPDGAPVRPAATVCAIAALVVAASLLVAAGAALGRGWPGYGWDGLSIWLVRAKVLARSSELPVALFREPLLVQGHWDYPLLLPALLAWFARAADLGVRELALPLGGVAATFPLALALGLWRALPAPAVAALALAPFAVPGLAVYHFHAYADPLLVMTALAGLAWTATGALRRDTPRIAAGALALACAASTKNEGALWLLAGALGAAALARASGSSWRAAGDVLARSALPGLAVFAGWRATCARLGVSDTLPASLRFDLAPARLSELASAALGFELASVQAPALLACAVAVWLLAGERPRERALRGAALLAAPALYAGGVVVVYLATPHALAWHVATSLPRTLFGVAPACLVGAVLAPTLARAARAARP